MSNVNLEDALDKAIKGLGFILAVAQRENNKARRYEKIVTTASRTLEDSKKSLAQYRSQVTFPPSIPTPGPGKVCETCGGLGEFECFQNAWGEHGSACPTCQGSGLKGE